MQGTGCADAGRGQVGVRCGSEGRPRASAGQSEHPTRSGSLDPGDRHKSAATTGTQGQRRDPGEGARCGTGLSRRHLPPHPPPPVGGQSRQPLRRAARGVSAVASASGCGGMPSDTIGWLRPYLLPLQPIRRRPCMQFPSAWDTWDAASQVGAVTGEVPGGRRGACVLALTARVSWTTVPAPSGAQVGRRAEPCRPPAPGSTGLTAGPRPSRGRAGAPSTRSTPLG